MKIIIKTMLLIVISLSLQNISYAADVNKVDNESISINNREEARLAYPLALYYRERAISKFLKNENGADDIERSNEILKDILKFNSVKEVYNTLSENYELMGDYQNSIDVLSDILKKDIHNVDILIKIAQKYFFVFQDYDKSEYYIQKAFELEPYNNNVLILLGYINYDRDKDYVKSCFYFSKVDESKDIDGEFESIDYNIYYSLAAFYNGMYSLARERMLKVDNNELRDKDFLYSVITKSSQILEDYQKAYSVAQNVYADIYNEESLYYVALMSVIVGKYDKESFDRIKKSKRIAPRIIEIASIADGASSNNKKAIEEIEKEFDKGNFDLDLMQLYYVLISRDGTESDILEAKKLLTDFYLTLQSYDSMLKHMYSIAEKSSDSDRDVVISMYFKMMNGFYMNNDFEKAKITIDEYIKILHIYSIEDSKYYLPVISILYNMKEYNLAFSTLEALISFENESNKTKYDYVKAYIYSLMKDKEKTSDYINSFIKYIKQNDEDANLSNLNTLYVSAFNVENKELAYEVVNMIYSKYKYTSSANSLAWTLIYFDIDVDNGIKTVKKALKDDTTNIYYLDTLAWGYYKKGEYDKAIRIFLNLLFRANEYFGETKIEIFLHTAETYYALGYKDEALSYYLKTKAAMFESDSNYIEYVEAKIKELMK